MVNPVVSLSVLTSIDAAEISARKDFLEFTESDIVLLKELHALLEKEKFFFADEFYRHILNFPELKVLIKDEAMLARLKLSQHAYFIRLTCGEYGPAYVEERLRVGAVHHRVGLTPKWYIGAYRKYLAEIPPVVWRLMGTDPKRYQDTLGALNKIVFFDMALALETYSYAERQALIRMQGYAEQIIAGMPSGLLVVDMDLVIRSVNPELARMFGLDMNACAGKHLSDLLEFKKLKSDIAAVMKSGEPHSGIAFEYALASGETGYYLANISRSDMDDEKLLYLMVQDMTMGKVAETQIQYLAQHDSLTGLPNRSMVCDRIDYACALSRRGEGAVVTMLIDLSGFNVINDSLGYAHGDELLKQVATRLNGCLRESDTVGRTGGNEFVIIMLRTNAAADAGIVAKKVLEELEVAFQLAEHQLHLSANIGVAVAPADGENAQALLKSAATALHQAKKDGRNQVYFFQAEMNQRVQREMQLASGLYRALDQGEFELHYQPKVDLLSDKICGLEALLRWRHPDHGLIHPIEFIPLLEENGMIIPVGEWVLQTACAQARAWQVSGIRDINVAVNLSVHQFRQAGLCEMVERILSATGLEAKYLELEITESAIMHNVDEVDYTLRRLKGTGVRLSVDDFGTGYSSLSYLKRFTIDALKVDRSFINDITTDPDDAMITRSVIQLAHNLGLKVVAEGVETAGQLAFLVQNLCDEIQGYYYSGPLPGAECFKLLSENRLLEYPQQNH